MLQSCLGVAWGGSTARGFWPLNVSRSCNVGAILVLGPSSNQNPFARDLKADVELKRATQDHTLDVGSASPCHSVMPLLSLSGLLSGTIGGG